jgi:hypothetical protein
MRAILLITFLVSLTLTSLRSTAAATTPPPPPDPPRGEFPWQL